ncbi:MAG: DUF533 domain-containing protein [Deltaproteobacteria bacterium]|jgi:tellurite resistance protein|nr:DUF533 domain-containing protein [Deltaproteobacteria bacterium]MBW2532758.1 DUF533 domain-containing protein [Deltaproteobacteria bacterium]
MHEQDRAILESLVSVAWADGTFDDKEKELLEGLLEAFGANEEEAAEVRKYAEEKRDLGDVPLTELSFDDRRALLQHAVLLSWVDGEQHETEKKFLDDLRAKLNIPEEEAAPLVEDATARAKRLLETLANE